MKQDDVQNILDACDQIDIRYLEAHQPMKLRHIYWDVIEELRSRCADLDYVIKDWKLDNPDWNK